MTDKHVRIFNDRSGKTHFDQKFVENEDGTFSEAMVEIGDTGLTDEQLRATPIEVTVVSDPEVKVLTYTASADMTTAAAITPAPATGETIVGYAIVVSTDTEMSYTVQMETTGNILAKLFVAANSTTTIAIPGGLKGDVANKKLFGKASVAGNVAVTVLHYSE